MAIVSSDHADESWCAELLRRPAAGPRLISPDEVRQHDGRSSSKFWAVIDTYVVDASEFVDTHPGGLRKLLSADSAATGATGKPFGFSFSRGRNAHFPDTGKRFHEGVKQYLAGVSDGGAALPPADIVFPPYGKIVILGRLEGT